MQQTKTEIISLSAYIPWSAIPASVQDEIEAEIRCGSLSRKNFSQDLDDSNTELFFIRQKNGSFDYAVTVNVFLSDDEQTETASIRLAGLTPQERNYIDMLIQERVIYALRHIDE